MQQIQQIPQTIQTPFYQNITPSTVPPPNTMYINPDIALLQVQIQQQTAQILNELQQQMNNTLSSQDQLQLFEQLQRLQQMGYQTQALQPQQHLANLPPVQPIPLSGNIHNDINGVANLLLQAQQIQANYNNSISTVPTNANPTAMMGYMMPPQQQPQPQPQFYFNIAPTQPVPTQYPSYYAPQPIIMTPQPIITNPTPDFYNMMPNNNSNNNNNPSNNKSNNNSNTTGKNNNSQSQQRETKQTHHHQKQSTHKKSKTVSSKDLWSSEVLRR